MLPSQYFNFCIISGFYAIGHHGRLLVDIVIVLSQMGMHFVFVGLKMKIYHLNNY